MCSLGSGESSRHIYPWVLQPLNQPESNLWDEWPGSKVGDCKSEVPGSETARLAHRSGGERKLLLASWRTRGMSRVEKKIKHNLDSSIGRSWRLCLQKKKRRKERRIWCQKRKIRKSSTVRGGKKKKPWTTTTFSCFFSSFSDLSVRPKFILFPVSFQCYFLNLLSNYCHRCQLSVCFGETPAAFKSVSGRSGWKASPREDKAQLQ